MTKRLFAQMAAVASILVFALSPSFAGDTKVAPSAANLALSRTALKNIHLQYSVVRLNLNTEMLTDSVGKLPLDIQIKYAGSLNAALEKLGPEIENIMVRQEAQKYSTAELKDIVALSAIPYFQRLVTTKIFKTEMPSDFAVSPAEIATINRLMPKPYVKGFIADCLAPNDDANFFLFLATSGVHDEYIK